MEITIVGIKKGKTKKGQECFNYFGTKPFSDYDQQNSECRGMDIISAFSYTDYNLEVGDLVDFRYEPGFEGRATLADIVMVRPAGNPPFEDKKETANKKSPGGTGMVIQE